MTDNHRYMRVAGLVFGQPLLCTAEAAENVGAYLRARIDGTAEPRASRFVGEDQSDLQTGEWKGYRKIESVAAISIMGELVNRGAWMGAASGLTSYEGILEQVRQAAADPEVKSILLDINSPGGEAWGMVDTSQQIRAAAAGKRLVALASPVAASAAYGLAAAADRIIVNESGAVGSIGVVMVHMDQSERLKSLGVKATVIATGSKKALGHPAVPLTEEALAVLQVRAERIMDGFVSLLEARRPGLTAEGLRALEGDIFIGADAVAAGLADAVGTFESVLADLSRAPGRSTSQMKGKRMSENNAAPVAEQTPGITKAQLDAAVAKATADAGTAFDAKIKADRERMAGLDKLAGRVGGNPKALELITAAKADGSSVEATAMKLIEMDAFKNAATLAALAADDKSATGAAPAAAGANDTAVPQTPEGWKTEYAGSAALQAEYGSEANYIGFKKAQAAGRVRILGDKPKAA